VAGQALAPKDQAGAAGAMEKSWFGLVKQSFHDRILRVWGGDELSVV
jgi:hypothetical protein